MFEFCVLIHLISHPCWFDVTSVIFICHVRARARVLGDHSYITSLTLASLYCHFRWSPSSPSPHVMFSLREENLYNKHSLFSCHLPLLIFQLKYITYYISTFQIISLTRCLGRSTTEPMQTFIVSMSGRSSTARPKFQKLCSAVSRRSVNRNAEYVVCFAVVYPVCNER